MLTGWSSMGQSVTNLKPARARWSRAVEGPCRPGPSQPRGSVPVVAQHLEGPADVVELVLDRAGAAAGSRAPKAPAGLAHGGGDRLALAQADARVDRRAGPEPFGLYEPSRRQKPTRMPYSCQPQLGIIGDGHDAGGRGDIPSATGRSISHSILNTV